MSSLLKGRAKTTALYEGADKYSSIVRRALTGWIDSGVHPKDGLFAERRDFLGSLITDIPRRAMVQARQIFVFCDWAEKKGSPDAGEFALKALDRTIDLFSGNDLRSGVAFSIDADGNTVSELRDAYTHAFLLFALAAAYKLTGEMRYVSYAGQLDSFICAHLMDCEHGGAYSSPLARKEKLQNPLMHLFEAYLFLHEAYPDGVYLQKAQSIRDLFVRRMLRTCPYVLPELFAPDWSAHPDFASGSYFEPGHHFEWIWLLTKFDSLSGADHTSQISGLWKTAREAGIDRYGYCYDAVDFSLKPRKRSIRLWPHAEGVKAAISMAHRGLDAENFAASMLDSLNNKFLSGPFTGGWIDQFDENGAPLVDFVPASSLYHIYLACSELENYTSTRRFSLPETSDFTNA